MNEFPPRRSLEPNAPKVEIAISATFVAEPIEIILSSWMAALGIDAKIQFAPFNQVFQQLLNPRSLLFTNAGGIKVILVRLSDWVNASAPSGAGLEASADLSSVVRLRIDEFVNALSAAIQRCPSTVLVFVCPERPANPHNRPLGAQPAALDEWEDLLVMKTRALPEVRVVTTREVASFYPVVDAFDVSADAMASIPYTPNYFAALGTMVARKVHQLRSAPHKVVILDCDGTLWDGVCGEDGPLGVRIDGGRRSLQEFIVGQSRNGMLVCLCSKNNPSDLLAVFEQRSDMVLKRQDITAWRINWRNKSENIQSLSRELRLGLDSFIFIDNDPVECAEVRARCPEVLTLALPEDANAIPSFLQQVWAFDRGPVSTEDQQRTQLYREHFERETLRRESPTLKDFLSNLNLQVDIAPLVEHDTARVSELTFRTNQFNLTSAKRSVAQIGQFLRVDRGDCLTVRVRDRFGDYGLVGVVFCQTHGDALLIDTFLLSCRALGRGVEHRLLAALGEIAVSRGLSYVDLCFIPSNQNEPAMDFLRELPNAVPTTLDDQTLYRIAAGAAAQTIYDPDILHGSIDRETDANSVTIAESRPDACQRAAFLSSIPERLWNPALIHSWARQSHSRSELDVAFIKPVTPAEVRIAGFFSELLRVEQVGVNDGFFQLGGHSLLAMQLLSRINAAFGVTIEPIMLFTSKITVAELALAVLGDQLRQQNPQGVESILDSLAALTDDEP